MHFIIISWILVLFGPISKLQNARLLLLQPELSTAWYFPRGRCHKSHGPTTALQRITCTPGLRRRGRSPCTARSHCPCCDAHRALGNNSAMLQLCWNVKGLEGLEPVKTASSICMLMLVFIHDATEHSAYDFKTLGLATKYVFRGFVGSLVSTSRSGANLCS